MTKELQTPNMDLPYQVKMAESHWLFHGWVESSLVQQKELYNNHNRIQNAVLRKECSSMKLWLRLWTNFNPVNCLNLKNQDGVVLDLWF